MNNLFPLVVWYLKFTLNIIIVLALTRVMHFKSIVPIVHRVYNHRDIIMFPSL